MTLKNKRAPLLSNIKLCASFHRHMWIQTGVTVRKRLSWLLTSVTLTFDLWPWPFAWTSLLSLVITPENFMMIRWWEHSQEGVTDRQTDGRTEKYLIISWYLHVWNGVAVAAYSRLASRSQAKFHTKKLSALVRPCAAAPAQSTTSAYRSLDFRRATSSQRGRWVGSWPLLLRSIHEDTS